MNWAKTGFSPKTTNLFFFFGLCVDSFIFEMKLIISPHISTNGIVS